MKHFKSLFFLSLLSILFIGCAQEPQTQAESSVFTNKSEILINEEVSLDASASTYDDLKWYVQGTELTSCGSSEFCTLQFSEPGTYVIEVATTLKGGTSVLGETAADTKDVGFVTLQVYSSTEDARK